MNPRPKRQPMVQCTHCGRDNDPDRGSKNCWYCGQPISQAQTDPHPDPRTEDYIARLVSEAPKPTPAQRDRLARLLRPARTPGETRPAA